MALKATRLLREALYLYRAGRRDEALAKVKAAGEHALEYRQPRLLSDAAKLYRAMGGDSDTAERWSLRAEDIRATRRVWASR